MRLSCVPTFALATVATLLLTAVPARAGSPWLPAPGAGNVNLSYTYQTADEFYRNTTKVPTPGNVGEDLVQHTTYVEVRYGLLDNIAIDGRIGYAQSHYGFDPSRGNGAISDKSPDGLADVNLGITYRFLDETITESPLLPTLAIRFGGIIAGDYESGDINSIGDGGDGFEISGMAGKFLGDMFVVSSEFGYRNRSNDVPDNLFLNLSGGIVLFNRIVLNISYQRVDTPWSSFDIGDPGFSPITGVFPELKEETELIGGGFNVAVTDSMNLGFQYASVIEGRNTAASDVFSVSLGYSFDTY